MVETCGQIPRVTARVEAVALRMKVPAVIWDSKLQVDIMSLVDIMSHCHSMRVVA